MDQIKKVPRVCVVAALAELYRSKSKRTAERYVAKLPHEVVCGRLVLICVDAISAALGPTVAARAVELFREAASGKGAA